MENARKNRVGSSAAAEDAKALFAIMGVDPTPQQREELNDLLYWLWNVDGIRLSLFAMRCLVADGRNSRTVEGLRRFSVEEGSNYMETLIYFVEKNKK